MPALAAFGCWQAVLTQLAPAFSLAKSLARYTWAQEGSAGPFWVQDQVYQLQNPLFLQFISKSSLH